MEKVLFALTFFLITTVHAASVQQDQVNPISRRFQVLPEASSLLTLGKAHSRELNGDSLKALIWNIKKAELDNWRQEFKNYSRGRDLLILQEAYGSDFFHSTLQKFEGFRWDMGISFLYKKRNFIPTGTMIGSSVEPTISLVKHSPDVEPVVETPKAMTFAKYPVAGSPDELLVISVHAINFTTTSAFKRHIDRAAKEIEEHSGPVLFAGDFNTWNRSRTNYLFDICHKLGLKEVSFKNGDQRMKFGSYFLDHSFVRGVSIKNAEVIGNSIGSDHKPLLLELDIL